MNEVQPIGSVYVLRQKRSKQAAFNSHSAALAWAEEHLGLGRDAWEVDPNLASRWFHVSGASIKSLTLFSIR